MVINHHLLRRINSSLPQWKSSQKTVQDTMVKSPKIEIFENFEKSAPSKIENLVEISMFFNEMVIRPTNKVQETHLWYWFFKPDRLVKVSDFLKWFQSDFFNIWLKPYFFLVPLLLIYICLKSVNPMVWRCREFFFSKISVV